MVKVLLGTSIGDREAIPNWVVGGRSKIAVSAGMVKVLLGTSIGDREAIPDWIVGRQ